MATLASTHPQVRAAGLSRPLMLAARSLASAASLSCARAAPARTRSALLYGLLSWAGGATLSRLRTTHARRAHTRMDNAGSEEAKYCFATEKHIFAGDLDTGDTRRSNI